MGRSRSRQRASEAPHERAQPVTVGPGQVLQTSGELRRLALTDIDVPRLRIRRDLGAVDDLAHSLGTVGILQPVQVSRAGERYRLIAGERRVQAARLLGWTEIDALIREPRGDELLLELVENAQRKFLTDAEEADAFIRLVRDSGLQVTEVGAQAGRSEAYVSKRIRVFEDSALRNAVERQRMPVSLAEEFLTVPIEDRPALLAQAIAEQWDVQRVRRVLRAPRVELELPGPEAQPESRVEWPSSATTVTIEGTFREVDGASDQFANVSQPDSAGNTPQSREIIKQLRLARDLIRELRPYELTPTQERALADLLQALLRLARARQRAARGPVFPTFEEAERLVRGR